MQQQNGQSPQAEDAAVRRDDLFTAAEATDIAGGPESAAEEKTPLQRAAERILAVSGQRRAEQRGGADWEGLFRRFPEAGGQKLPDEVFEAVRQGMTPVEAYQQGRIRELEAEKSALEGARRSVGPLSGDGAPAESDPFLSGLNQ